MDDFSFRAGCRGCTSKVVCHCMNVTEDTILEALATFDIDTVKDLRHYTGAGDGCTCCHRQLRQMIESHKARVAQPSPSSAAAI
ncbi:MAG: (2Fe-2S)-binding protein [Gemmataceae bacterium]